MTLDKQEGVQPRKGGDPQEPSRNEGADVRAAATKLQAFLQLLPRELGTDQFGDPSLMMLLDLLLAEFEKRRLPIKSVCIGSGAPQSTALRYIDKLEAAGLVKRHANPCDRRSAHIALAPETSALLRSSLASLAADLKGAS